MGSTLSRPIYLHMRNMEAPCICLGYAGAYRYTDALSIGEGRTRVANTDLLTMEDCTWSCLFSSDVPTKKRKRCGGRERDPLFLSFSGALFVGNQKKVNVFENLKIDSFTVFIQRTNHTSKYYRTYHLSYHTYIS